MARKSPLPAGAGVGLRLPHLTEIAATRPAADWFEIHPENFLANPHAAELLLDIARNYPISVHTVGVSVGSASGLDHAHLRRVGELIDRINPILVSGHLAWSTHEGEYLNDLLPLPYDDATLRLVAQQIDEVQDCLGRPYLLENPSSYIGFHGSTMSETQFLVELADQTGCQILCDVSNIYLSAHNMGYDAHEYIDALPPETIAQIHLGGFAAEADESNCGAEMLIDTHGNCIAEPVWELYAYALRRLGPKPTLIEWDNDIPPFCTLLSEAARADEVLVRNLAPGVSHVAAE